MVLIVMAGTMHTLLLTRMGSIADDDCFSFGPVWERCLQSELPEAALIYACYKLLPWCCEI